MIERHLNWHAVILKMSDQWVNIKHEAEGRHLVVLGNDVYLPFKDGSLRVIANNRDKFYIYDVFMGEDYDASGEQVMEYVRKLHLLPTPTYPKSLQIDKMKMKTTKIGDYLGIRRPQLAMIYVCDQYAFIRDRKCYRIVVSGDWIRVPEIGGDVCYTAESLVLAL